MAAQRVDEEQEAGEAIAKLERMDVDSPEFAAGFEGLTASVIAHAEAEEQEELPALQGVADQAQLDRLSAVLSLVPHQAVDSVAGGARFKIMLAAAAAAAAKRFGQD